MRAEGQRLNIIMVAEGAIDRDGTPISADLVKDVIAKTLNYDTRVSCQCEKVIEIRFRRS